MAVLLGELIAIAPPLHPPNFARPQKSQVDGHNPEWPPQWPMQEGSGAVIEL